jgi:nicotinate phosphoribosyltransferase
MTLPGLKQVWRVVQDGIVTHDTLGLVGESQVGRPLLRCVMRDGKRIVPGHTVEEIAQRARRLREQLPALVRAIDRVEPIEPQVTPALRALADSIAEKRSRAEL